MNHVTIDLHRFLRSLYGALFGVVLVSMSMTIPARAQKLDRWHDAFGAGARLRRWSLRFEWL